MDIFFNWREFSLIAFIWVQAFLMGAFMGVNHTPNKHV